MKGIRLSTSKIVLYFEAKCYIRDFALVLKCDLLSHFRENAESSMRDSAFLQFIESKVIDAGETVSAKNLSVDLNISLPRARSLLTSFVQSSKIDLVYYVIEISEERVCLKIKKSSEYSIEHLAEAVAAVHHTEDFVRNDLEYLLENQLGNGIRF